MTNRATAVIVIVLVLTSAGVEAQRPATLHPDLQGTWIGTTLTPLERPAEFKEHPSFTQAEADEYVRTRTERVRSRLPTDYDRLLQVDVDATYVEEEAIVLDGLRTSVIVDPPNGMLPPLLPAVAKRIAARPKRGFDDPETLNLAERCLMGNPPLGGSTASPPLLSNPVLAAYYQIVQTDVAVMIFSEWMHDVRVVRMNGTHVDSSIRKWLGDSIGRWEGETLVVDTTNFRPETHVLDSGERLHVIERFTSVDANTLRYRVTVDDPETWASPWTAEWSFKSTDARLYEVACHEGNYSMENSLRGARDEERRAAKH